MSASNLDALMEAFQAARDNRPDAFFDLLDEDVVWDVGNFPGGRFHGREGVREFFRQWVGTFEDWDFEVRQWVDAGHSVFVHMHQRGRGKTSGAAAEIDFWQVWLFFEGKVVRFVQKPDRESALEAAGLPPREEGNVEVVRRIYTEWERGNLSAGLPLYDPEIRFESFDYEDPDESFVGRGPEDLQRFVRKWLAQWGEYRIIGEEFTALDDTHVLVSGYHAATGRQSGVPVRDPQFAVWRFREGRIIGFTMGRDRARVLAAAGVAE